MSGVRTTSKSTIIVLAIGDHIPRDFFFHTGELLHYRADGVSMHDIDQTVHSFDVRTEFLSLTCQTTDKENFH